MNLKQPVLGIAASAAIILISMAVIALFDFPTFAGWVSYGLICIIPMEIVVGITWGTDHPKFAASQPQPVRGILLILTTVVIGAVVGVVHQYTLNGGGAQPTPMVIHALIVSVVVTFWLAIMWGGWPFTQMSSPLATGLTLLAACYLVNYLLFRFLFNYAFLEGAPVYVPALDPGGLFNGGTMVVFYVTFIAIMFLFLHFDLWPMTTSPSIMKQPVLGIVWTVICLVLGGGLFYTGVVLMGMDPQAFMVTIPIPFIFGTIIVLNMMHNSIFASLKQPAKGVANAVAAMVVGSILAVVYGALAPTLTGPLAEGPPAYEYEIWLASALLAVTFPFLIFFAEFFKMWPMMKGK